MYFEVWFGGFFFHCWSEFIVKLVNWKGLCVLRVCFWGFCFQCWHGWYGSVCFENWLYLKGYLEAYRFTFDMCWFWSLLIEGIFFLFFSCITCILGVIWKYELIFFYKCFMEGCLGICWFLVGLGYVMDLFLFWVVWELLISFWFAFFLSISLIYFHISGYENIASSGFGPFDCWCASP